MGTTGQKHDQKNKKTIITNNNNLGKSKTNLDFSLNHLFKHVKKTAVQKQHIHTKTILFHSPVILYDIDLISNHLLHHKTNM